MRQNRVVTQGHRGEVDSDGVTIRKPALINSVIKIPKLNYIATSDISGLSHLPSPTGYTAADPTLGRRRQRTHSMSSLITTNTEKAEEKKFSGDVVEKSQRYTNR